MTVPDFSLPALVALLGDFFLYIPGKPMFFTDGQFLVYLFLFLGSFSLAGNHVQTKRNIILVFSLWFYYKSTGLYLFLLLLMAVFTWLAARMSVTAGRSGRIRYIYAGIAANLLILAFFKYTPFFHQLGELVRMGDFQAGAIAFPVGLSFYTFNNLSYLFDVKKGNMEPERSPWHYIRYLSFFPLVQMGPLERANRLIPAMKELQPVSRGDSGEGFQLLVSGIFKKMVLGDFISHRLVMVVLSSPERHTGMEILAAYLGYALVIYCDFSGYTDMARGLARWMGIPVSINFNSPYKARNIGDFWRRWHITLSNWLRDYIFLPVALKLSSLIKREYILPGRLVRTDLFIFTVASVVTFVICGIWHGSSINFLIWGLMHGIALSVHRTLHYSLKDARKSRSKFSRSIRQRAGILMTFLFVTAGWIVFRTDSPAQAWMTVSRITSDFGGQYFTAFVTAYAYPLAVMTFGYLVHFMPDKLSARAESAVAGSPLATRLLITALLLVLVVTHQRQGSPMPIYIRF